MSTKLFVQQIISWAIHHKFHGIFQFTLTLVGMAFFITAIISTPWPINLLVLLGYTTLCVNFIFFDFMAMRHFKAESKRLRAESNRLHKEWLDKIHKETERLKNEQRNS